MPLDDHDLQTESFSNAKGWSAVRVTHLPSATVAERHRSEALRSAVQAQRECIDELERTVSNPARSLDLRHADIDALAVSRQELAALETRVATLERRLEELGRG